MGGITLADVERAVKTTADTVLRNEQYFCDLDGLAGEVVPHAELERAGPHERRARDAVEDEVLRHRERADEAVRRPVLGHVADAGVEHLAHRAAEQLDAELA